MRFFSLSDLVFTCSEFWRSLARVVAANKLFGKGCRCGRIRNRFARFRLCLLVAGGGRVMKDSFVFF